MWTNKIAFIGAGNIAEVIMDRLVAIGSHNPTQFFACDTKTTRRSYLREHFLGLRTSEDPREAVQFARLVFIATPADAALGAIHEVCHILTPEHVLVCLATSVRLAQLEAAAPDAAVARALINTPSMVGEGMNLVVFGRHVSTEYRQRLNALLDLFGTKFEVSDAQMDFWCAICSAGPASVLPVIEALAKAAIARGISREQALVGASQVVLGAARMVQQTGRDPKDRRSPAEDSP
ncbi:MAG: NAD(P)-binding domain-containing protein [Acidobacteria bacterium]|nr:NAD(P)-binding domain-containing protein [Acidobacteriota bacterium]